MKRMLAFSMLFAIIACSSAFAQKFESPYLAYGFSAGGAQGDNSNDDKWVPQFQGFLQYRLVPNYVLGQVNLGYTKLRASGVYEADIIMLDNRFLFSPFTLPNVNPYLYAGFGVAKDLNKGQEYMPMIPVGVGMQTKLNEWVMLQVSGGYHLVLSDKLSETKSTSSKRNTFTNGKQDGFYGFLIGLTITWPEPVAVTDNGAQNRTNYLTVSTDTGIEKDGGEVRWADPIESLPIIIIEKGSIPVTLQKGNIVILRGVNFEFDKSSLTELSNDILEIAYQSLASNPDTRVQIAGYTDNVGAEDYNQKLSERRAEAVNTWLVKRGVSSTRMTTVGRGELEPVANNSTAVGRAANRCIVFFVQQ